MPGLFGFGEGVRELLVMLNEVFLLVLLVIFRFAGALYVTIGSLVYSISSVTMCFIKAQISTNTSNFDSETSLASLLMQSRAAWVTPSTFFRSFISLLKLPRMEFI